MNVRAQSGTLPLLVVAAFTFTLVPIAGAFETLTDEQLAQVSGGQCPHCAKRIGYCHLQTMFCCKEFKGADCWTCSETNQDEYECIAGGATGDTCTDVFIEEQCGIWVRGECELVGGWPYQYWACKYQGGYQSELPCGRRYYSGDACLY